MVIRWPTPTMIPRNPTVVKRVNGDVGSNATYGLLVCSKESLEPDAAYRFAKEVVTPKNRATLAPVCPYCCTAS